MLAMGSFAVVGAYLSNQIANNLFQERLAQAESETRYNVKQVQDTFDGAQVTDQSSVITLVYDTLNAVEGRGSVIQRRYVFEAMPEQTKPRNRWVESRASDQLTISVIPPDLRKAVQDSGKDQYWASTRVPGGDRRPARHRRRQQGDLQRHGLRALPDLRPQHGAEDPRRDPERPAGRRRACWCS